MFKQISPICCRLSFAMFVLLLGSRPAMTQESKSVVLELDHVSVCGSSLDSLRQDFTAVGLTPDEGGPHGNGITQMALIAFDDGTYIELIAPIKPGVSAGSDWSKFMSDPAVTCAWAVETQRFVARGRPAQKSWDRSHGSRARQPQASRWHVDRVDESERRPWNSGILTAVHHRRSDAARLAGPELAERARSAG